MIINNLQYEENLNAATKTETTEVSVEGGSYTCYYPKYDSYYPKKEYDSYYPKKEYDCYYPKKEYDCYYPKKEYYGCY